MHWHLGRLVWSEALTAGRIAIDGSPPLVRAFPSWLPPNYVAQTAAGARSLPSAGN